MKRFALIAIAVALGVPALASAQRAGSAGAVSVQRFEPVRVIVPDRGIDRIRPDIDRFRPDDVRFRPDVDRVRPDVRRERPDPDVRRRAHEPNRRRWHKHNHKMRRRYNAAHN